MHPPAALFIFGTEPWSATLKPAVQTEPSGVAGADVVQPALLRRQVDGAGLRRFVLHHLQRDMHQTTFALGESVAHVHALQTAGRLKEVASSDGVLRYTTV